MKKILFLFVGVVGLAGCSADTAQPTAEPAVFEISPSIAGIFINEAVDFSLVDIETGEPVETSWADRMYQVLFNQSA